MTYYKMILIIYCTKILVIFFPLELKRMPGLKYIHIYIEREKHAE